MARRREGRELFEIFKETKAAPSEHGAAKAPYVARGPRETAAGPALHTLRLGDRPQVEVFMSLGWAYGLIIFVFMALLASFILGRRMAPKAEEVATMEAPAEFEAEAARVGEVRREAETAADTPTIAVAGGAGGVTLPGAGSEVEADPEAVTSPAPVPSPGKYTLRVAYYKNTASQAKMAKDFVAFLKSKDFEDAKVVSGRDPKNLYVTIGSYETSRGEKAQELIEKVKRLSYKGHDFSKVYFQNVNTL